MKLFDIRNTYEDKQRYGYILDNLDPDTKNIPMREAREKLPPYADPYLAKNRARIMERQKQREKDLEELRTSQDKHTRYYAFKEQFQDVFEEYKLITTEQQKQITDGEKTKE